MSEESNYRLLSANDERRSKHYDDDDDHSIQIQHHSRMKKKKKKRVRFTSDKTPTIAERLYYGYNRLTIKTRLKFKVTILGIMTLLSIILIRRYVPPINDDLFTYLNIQFNISTRTFQLSNLTRQHQILLSGKLGCKIGYEIPRITTKINQLHLLWEDKTSLTMSKISDDCTSFTWQPTSNQWTSLCDCFRLDRGYWYSGSEMHKQFWPLKDAEIPSQPYISSYKLISYGSVLEKMWFNSNGLIVIANQTKQLSVQVTKNNLCLQSYATNHTLQYQVCSHHDLKNVYQIYAKRLFELPTTAKDDDLFRTIIWTMSNQHMSINQSMVEYYADQIVRYQFNQSIIELGDDYSTAHGDFDFDQNRFPNVSKTIFQLHQWGLKISLSVSVIASINSQTFQQGIENNYWVRRKDKYSQDVLAIIKWSRGNGVLLDVTNPQARRWFTSRLIKFQHDYHIDYFNFLHGEADYLPADMVTFGTLDDPNHYTRLFNKMVSDIASISFVEAAYQAQQLNPIIQMQRKDSSWSNVTGLPSIIPSAITLGLIGYPLFTPATINNFDFATLSTKLDRDLYIRWIQLSCYLPILKLSTGPWNFDVQAIAFLQKLIQFRRQFLVPKFIQINQQLTSTGLPIVRPIWWLAPKDTTAQNVFDEFLIGDDILVAPIVQKKTNSRKIYLPRGYWFDAISKTNFSVAVGRWLTNYVTQYTQTAYFIYSPWK